MSANSDFQTHCFIMRLAAIKMLWNILVHARCDSEVETVILAKDAVTLPHLLLINTKGEGKIREGFMCLHHAIMPVIHLHGSLLAVAWDSMNINDTRREYRVCCSSDSNLCYRSDIYRRDKQRANKGNLTQQFCMLQDLREVNIMINNGRETYNIDVAAYAGEHN